MVWYDKIWQHNNSSPAFHESFGFPVYSKRCTIMCVTLSKVVDWASVELSLPRFPGPQVYQFKSSQSPILRVLVSLVPKCTSPNLPSTVCEAGPRSLFWGTCLKVPTCKNFFLHKPFKKCIQIHYQSLKKCFLFDVFYPKHTLERSQQYQFLVEIRFPCGHFWEISIFSVSSTETMEISQKWPQGNPISTRN